jgi:hypothetical protein
VTERGRANRFTVRSLTFGDFAVENQKVLGEPVKRRLRSVSAARFPVMPTHAPVEPQGGSFLTAGRDAPNEPNDGRPDDDKTSAWPRMQVISSVPRLSHQSLTFASKPTM